MSTKEEEGKNGEERSPRLEFKSWFEYFFSVNNLCIGLSNFLVFPAKVHEYRGGAFIIAYGLMLIIIGYPVLYLELIIGQYHRCSPIVFIRRSAPILQGFGYLALVSSITTIYPYQYSVARSFKFIVSLFTSGSRKMIWSKCENTWNTEHCYEFYNENCPNLETAHIVFRGECVNETALEGAVSKSAEEEYLRYIVHDTGPTHMSFTRFDYGVAYSMFILWLSIAFVQNRTGTKTTSVIYVPTIFVFLICPFLFFRALHLDGAISGVKEMFRVEWAELLYSKIWIDALSLVIQSLSLGIGGHSILASFAPAEKYTFLIATSAVFIDTSLSLITSGTVFSILGFMAFTVGRRSVYGITVIPPGPLLTHSTVPVLLRKVANNAWLWVLLYYFALIIVGWKSCSLVLKTISTTIADIFHFSSKTFVFDIFSLFVSIVLATLGLFLCFESGPMYIPMINDVQKLATGLFMTGLLLTVLEFYGLKMIYEDIYSLMGRPSNLQWNQAYSWSIWKSRWKLAPAFSLIYALSTFFRKDFSPEADLVYYYYYDFIQFVLTFFILLQTLAFAIYGYHKIYHHLKQHEKSKTFNISVLWKPQRSLRSWSRIRSEMSQEEQNFAEECLPDMEPEDLNGFWKTVYNSLIKTIVVKKRVLEQLEDPSKKPSFQKAIDEPTLSFDAIEGFNKCLIIFVPHGPLYEFPVLSQNLISLRCGMCAYTFALLAVHFLYRYMAVCKPLALARFFQLKTIFLNAIFVMCYGSSWMLIGHIIMWPDEHIHSLIDSKFKEVHNISSRNLAMIVANYEYPVYNWAKSGILGMFIATVVTTSIMVSYIIFSIQIRQSLRACTLSEAVKKLHSSLLKSLIAQTIFPLISTIIPCFVIWFLPIAGDRYGVVLSTYFMPLLSIYPAIDPLVVTCSLSDYRNAILTSIGYRRKEKSPTNSKPQFDLFTSIPPITEN